MGGFVGTNGFSNALASSVQSVLELTLIGASIGGASSHEALEPAELKADHAIVLNAVEQDGCALRCAAEELKGDHAIVLAAVQQGGDAL
eukprot:3939284-Amphidinium_carterae.1